MYFSDNLSHDPASHPNTNSETFGHFLINLIINAAFFINWTETSQLMKVLCSYKGRLGWIQYVPLKRARFGIKSFMLCESKSGYICGTQLHTLEWVLC